MSTAAYWDVYSCVLGCLLPSVHYGLLGCWCLLLCTGMLVSTAVCYHVDDYCGVLGCLLGCLLLRTQMFTAVCPLLSTKAFTDVY